MPAVVSIYDELLARTTNTWSEEPEPLAQRIATLHARNARGFATLVASEAEIVLGVATFADFRDSLSKPGYRFTVEHSVNVLSSAWGRGVGRLLMQRLLERARARGMHAMVGAIDGANQRSLDFHFALGFREVGRMPELGWKHGRWCELVLVQRFIDAAGSPR